MEQEKTNPFVVTRQFKAPRKMVFDAFTQAERLAHWWGPIGFKLHVAHLDLRPGGTFHYSMVNDVGFEMWGLFTYLDILAPEKIIFLSGFSDKDAAIAKSPFGFPWPLQTHNTWALTEEKGITTLVLTAYPVNAEEEEERSFVDGFGSMQQGFGGTFDQLDEYLKTVTGI